MIGSRRPPRYDTATDPSRGWIRREVASALGMLVILFNLIAGTAVAATTAGGAPFLDDAFGDRIVVCTGAGMIVLDAEGKPVDGGDTIAPLCVFCLPLVGGAVDAPAATVAVVLVRAREPAPAVAERHAPPTPTVLQPTGSPRGPPRALPSAVAPIA